MTETQVKPFQREERYIVLKRKHLTPDMEKSLRGEIADVGIPTVECVVVESDWPEYETVWAMIEARCTGRSTPTTSPELVEAAARLICPAAFRDADRKDDQSTARNRARKVLALQTTPSQPMIEALREAALGKQWRTNHGVHSDSMNAPMKFESGDNVQVLRRDGRKDGPWDASRIEWHHQGVASDILAFTLTNRTLLSQQEQGT